jgi:hypothetical protein
MCEYEDGDDDGDAPAGTAEAMMMCRYLTKLGTALQARDVKQLKCLVAEAKDAYANSSSSDDDDDGGCDGGDGGGGVCGGIGIGIGSDDDGAADGAPRLVGLVVGFAEGLARSIAVVNLALGNAVQTFQHWKQGGGKVHMGNTRAEKRAAGRRDGGHGPN